MLNERLMVRILIVDDNADIRMLLRIQLGMVDGVDELLEATNGLEAIERAGQDHPDIIILDLDMPVMSGDAALPLLRTVAPRAYIVVNSATPIESAPREGLQHADAYLLKPRDDVADLVGRLLQERRSNRGAAQ